MMPDCFNDIYRISEWLARFVSRFALGPSKGAGIFNGLHKCFVDRAAVYEFHGLWSEGCFRSGEVDGCGRSWEGGEAGGGWEGLAVGVVLVAGVGIRKGFVPQVALQVC